MRKLTIDGVDVDLPTDFNPSFSYEINDDGIILCARAKRSIKLASTTTNDTLFEDWGVVATLNPKATTLKPFNFEAGGITLLSGQAQLQQAELMSNRSRQRAQNYEVDLFGTNADWFFLLKDLKLSDLEYTDKIYNLAAVVSGWISSYDAGDETGFCLVKWKEWNTPGVVDIDEFTPFVFIKTLLDKAFSTIGYSIVSNFMSTDNFKKLIMLAPLPARYPQQFSIEYINVGLYQPPANISSLNSAYQFPVQNQTPIFGPNPYSSVTGFYTAPFSGYYEVDISVAIISTIGTWGLTLLASVDANVVPPDSTFQVLFGLAQTGSRSSRITSNVIFLNAGQTIGLVNFIGASDVTTTFEISFNIRGEADATFGTFIAFRYLFNNYKLSDMIKGLQQMFNLRFEADTERQTVRIEPADAYLYFNNSTPVSSVGGFYRSTGIEQIENLDLQGEAKLYSVSDQAQKQIFKYITEGDTDEFVDGENPLGFFAAQHKLPDSKFNDATNENENVFFAKTINEIDSDLRDAISGVDIQLPLIYPKNYVLDPTAIEANFDVLPRILYFAGIRAGDGVINYSFLGAPYARPFAFMVNYSNSLDWSLSFADEKVRGVTVLGLLSSFYLQDFARRRVSKRLEVSYFWNSLSMSRLTFRDKVTIDSVEYVLQKIDGYKPLGDSSTRTILILDQSPEQEDAEAIAGGGVRGLVSLVI